MRTLDADAGHRRFLYRLAITWSLFAMAYMVAVTFCSLSQIGQHFADIILGFLLGTVVATILGYFYGGLFKPASTNAGSAAVPPLEPESNGGQSP